jgi:hypothetical protein
MDLSINELYQQYEKSIALQSDIIASCRRDLDRAKKERKNKQAAEISRYLRILYDEKNELMLNAHELRKYIETTQS